MKLCCINIKQEHYKNVNMLKFIKKKSNVLLGVQCYDKYLTKSLEKAAEARGHSFWGRPPDHAGSYNSQPQDTKFFCDGGEYDSGYGRFFLNWYSQTLIHHGDSVLSMANLAFESTPISVKVTSF